LAKLKILDVRQFLNSEIVEFHQKKLNRLQSIKLKEVLKKKNPYLFRAKNLIVANDLISEILDAFLFASEEKMFGDLLENLAIFIAGKVHDGKKSAATGIDLDFNKKSVRYLVSVKSGPNWGNSSQQEKQRQNFSKAVTVLKQANKDIQVQTVLGICYGKSKDSYLHGHLRTMGQSFWYLISGNRDLYTDIIEPLGHKARRHNEKFTEEKAKILNQFTLEFTLDFCDNGSINWKKFVEFNSGNMKR